MVAAAEQSKPQSTRRMAKHAENDRPVDICPKKISWQVMFTRAGYASSDFRLDEWVGPPPP